MQTALVVSGIVLWSLIAFYLLGWVQRRRWLQHLLARPSLYPYSQFAGEKLRAHGLSLRRRLGLVPPWTVPPEYIRSRKAVKLEHMKALRDAYQEVDQLPTVETGKKALGIDSMFDIVYRVAPGSRYGKGEYTDPYQNPPFFLPGVPARPFYEPSEFEWAKPLEEAFPVIKKELMGVLAEEGVGFKSYVNEYSGLIQGWNTYNFFFFGKKFEENCERCPETTALLESLPRFEKDHIMFSALNPHSVITPHYGPMNGILRAHLPMIVPEGCFIKVGEEERAWKEGELMVFDDSFLHQVWNHSDHLRIVLFLNFWHPCFASEEIPVLERFRTAYEKHPSAQQHAHNQAKKRSHNIKKTDERVKASAPATAPAT